MSGTTSETFNFQLPNNSVILEAFDRIQKRPTQEDRHMIQSARISLNLELLSWSNETWNYWKTVSGTIPLVAGQALYTLPANIVTIEEVLYTQVNAQGPGINTDRLMIPYERTQYSQIVNKGQQGIPTLFWFQMVIPPQLTIWQVPLPAQVGPNFVLTWFGLEQIEDANPAGLEIPDLPYRAYDALCARLALRLAEKFGPADPAAKQAMMKEKSGLAEVAWNHLQRRDQELGPGRINMNASVYGRMRV